MKIIIDAGHGGEDNGASGFGKVEKKVNLEYALKLRDILDDYDVIVSMTRNSDKTFELNSRAKWIHDQNADLVISCHTNAYDGKANGTETIYSIDASEKIEKLADTIARRLAKSLNVKFRRSFAMKNQNGKDYYCLHRVGTKNTIIVETLFIDNKEDVQTLFEKDWSTKASNTIANCIIEAFGLKKKTKPALDWKQIIRSVDTIEYKEEWIIKLDKLIKNNKEFESLPWLIRKLYER